ncbi:MAG: hypothetical protein UY64_C0004G0017 [Parcubacteria group bacterium GW2011_GWA1_51_12]|nr:MAG: hypothetical protein UY64_C0004G0017 [Parcubacteria group bacterium GW2011_GWA1_51_12]
MLRDLVLAILEQMPRNQFISLPSIQRELNRTRSWMRPSFKEINEVISEIGESRGIALEPFMLEGEEYIGGVALKEKISEMPLGSLMLYGVEIPGAIPISPSSLISERSSQFNWRRAVSRMANGIRHAFKR